MKKILLTLLTLITVSCAIKDDEDPVTSQERRDQQQSEKLKADYAEVEGLYTGTISASDREIPVELRLITQSIKSGTDSKGNIKELPILVAGLTLLDTLDNEYLLSASYDRNSGELVFFKQDNNSDFSIPARLVGNKIIGEVRRGSSPVGPIYLELKQKQFKQLEPIDIKIRKMKILKEVEGNYFAVLQLPSTKEKVQLSINIVESNDPFLAIKCKFVKNGVDESMAYTYFPHPKPSELNISRAATNQIPTCPFKNINGVIKNGKYSAVTFDHKGTVRNIEFIKE
jgi:hypothetical protein